MHLDIAVLKLKSNERESAKKKALFWTTFFLSILEAGSSAYIFPRLQYTYEARFKMLTYLCIQCAQSFTLEHYFAGSLFERYIDRDATKGIF